MSDTTYAVVVPVDGPIKIINLEQDHLAMFYREIGCHCVDVVSLGDLDMWVDDEGLMVDEPRTNARATGLVAASLGQPVQLFFGTAVVTAGVDDDGETQGLTREQARETRRVAIAAGKQLEAWLTARSLRQHGQEQN